MTKEYGMLSSFFIKLFHMKDEKVKEWWTFYVGAGFFCLDALFFSHGNLGLMAGNILHNYIPPSFTTLSKCPGQNYNHHLGLLEEAYFISIICVCAQAFILMPYDEYYIIIRNRFREFYYRYFQPNRFIRNKFQLNLLILSIILPGLYITFNDFYIRRDYIYMCVTHKTDIIDQIMGVFLTPISILCFIVILIGYISINLKTKQRS